ncbi:hypothetical protein K439DRAFT_1661837 [Ramaria rubella]|nr:hypothetical protein K439DRAFT_1661837 [Ramaria rubella]
MISPAIFVYSTRYVQVASMTLALYDHLLTFQNEIDFVWRGAHRRSWPRLLFLVARYAPLVALLSNSSAIFGIPHSSRVSRNWLLFHGWSGFIFFAAVQVISQLRLWAMYRSKNLLIAMGIITTLALVAMGYVEGAGYSRLNKVTTEVLGGIHICGPGINTLPKWIYLFWLPPLLVETLSVILVLHKAIRHFQGGAPKEWVGSRFISAIVRYSIIYFVVVLIVYVANFYVWFKLPIPAFELFLPLTFALPSVTGNRMLLSLRGVFHADHAILPGQDDIRLKVVNQDRGLIIETHNPLKEFESFFGENRSIKASFRAKR